MKYANPDHYYHYVYQSVVNRIFITVLHLFLTVGISLVFEMPYLLATALVVLAYVLLLAIYILFKVGKHFYTGSDLLGRDLF